MATKKKKAAPPVKKSVTIDDLTVSDIIVLLGDNLCDAKYRYLMFGSDLKAAFDKLSKDPSHLGAVTTVLDDCTDVEREQAVDKITDACMGVLNKKAPRRVVREIIDGRFEEDWFVIEKQEKEPPFEKFKRRLAYHIDTLVRESPSDFNFIFVNHYLKK